MRAILVVTLLFFAQFAKAETACPLGKEDHLTIQRVMINFGHFTMRPDFAALRGAKLPNETVTTEDLVQAANDLDGAIACAQAVIDGPTEDLLPSATDRVKSEERAAFIENFVYMMGEFQEGLVEYKALFAQLAETPEADRDFTEVYSKCQELNDLVDRSHRSTTPEVGFVPPLKDNMKTIKVLYKAIAASVTDAKKNTVNAANATKMHDLFVTVKAQVPPAITALPENQRAEALKGYQQMIQQAADMAAKLAEDLKAGKTADAQADLKQLDAMKVDGHHKYG
jgi:soluble cytochrome b562